MCFSLNTLKPTLALICSREKVFSISTFEFAILLIMTPKFLFLLSTLPLIASCNPVRVVDSSEESDNNSLLSSQSEESDESFSSSSQGGDSPQKEMSAEFQALFAHNSHVSFKIQISEATAKAINDLQSSRDSIYVDAYLPANVTLSLNGMDYVLEEVGIRMKGNTSRGTILGGDGKLETARHYKLKFNETFDDAIYDETPLLSFKKTWANDVERIARKDRELFGMNKLDLKVVPRNNDICELSEVYAYDAFRSKGLLAPYANLGSVEMQIEGHSESLTSTYELIESIDKSFLKKRFSKADAKGDLYKCVYNAMGKADLSRSGAVSKEKDSNGYTIGTRVAKGKIGVEDNFHSYAPVYQLKTNDSLGEDSDFSQMAAYLNAVYNVTYRSAPLSFLENVLDVDSFLKFSAVSWALGNFDDQRYNYNNYYLYFVPSSGKAIYIPYDFDWCLGNDEGRNLSKVAPFDAYTIDGGEEASIFYATFLKTSKSGSNISYDRSVLQDAYLSYCQDTKDILNYDNFKALSDASPYDTGVESSIVSSYMSTKLTHLA